MKYNINQYPKNKDIDISKLNEYQIEIRNNKKKYVYRGNKTCNKCFKTQPIEEYYIKDKTTGRRSNCCRDCRLKDEGVIEIGKYRFANKIEDKGFRRCSVCKEIKPLSEFKRNKGQKNGISNNCYECGNKLHNKFIMKQKKEIGDFYVRQYCLKNYGYIPETKSDIEKYRNEIKEKRKPKYFIDNKSFITVSDFAEYIKNKYGNPISMTKKRISDGKTEDECKLSEFEMRSKHRTKGKIKVTDTITKESFYFKNSLDKDLLKMFSKATVTRVIKTGKPTRITKISKYKNPCIIKRIKS